MPGDNVNLEVALIAPIAMEKGVRFAIREGGRTVVPAPSRNRRVEAVVPVRARAASVAAYREESKVRSW